MSFTNPSIHEVRRPEEIENRLSKFRQIEAAPLTLRHETEEKLKESRQLIADRFSERPELEPTDQVSFGGLGIVEIKHLNGSGMISDARNMRRRASELESLARAKEARGEPGSFSLRDQARSLKSKADVEERKGKREISEANNIRKREQNKRTER